MAPPPVRDDGGTPSIVETVRGLDDKGKVAATVGADLLNRTSEQVRVALRYRASFPDVIAAEVSLTDAESQAAKP